MSMVLSSKIRAKVRREAIYLSRDIQHILGLNNDFYKNARGSRMLIYHGICKDAHTRFNSIFLKLKTFETHLKLYKKHFNVVSLDDFYRQNFSADKFNICITFDDGFANNYRYVLPLLEKYKLPASFFITGITDAGYDILWNDFLAIITKYGPETMVYKNESYKKDRHKQYTPVKGGISIKETLRAGGFEDKAEMMELLYPLAPFKKDHKNEDYWVQMTREQIRQLSLSPYAHIGAHGYYHNDLANININEAYAEMAKTKQYLEAIIQKPVTSLAFPYGSYTAQVIEIAKQAGYRQLLATDFRNDGDEADTSLRERFTVNPFISPVNQLYATINRRYE